MYLFMCGLFVTIIVAAGVFLDGDLRFNIVVCAMSLWAFTLALVDVTRAHPRFKQRLLNFRHNVIAHPIAGFLWLFGCEKWGDWVHNHW